jgi:ubiquinone/menaquinone biosynthesis C-methylase UbiE
MRRLLPTLLTVLALSVPAPAQQAPAPAEPAAGQERPKARKAARRPSRPPHRETGRTYMGRPIADVMSYLGADWLFRPERIEEERPDEMLDALRIQPGWTVADVGAGAGYTSLRLSQRVGPKGVVLATDIQPQMLQMLRVNARAAGITNIRPILCTQDDPKLPKGQVDLAIMVDVYHEMSNPATSLKGIRAALKPGGRLVLVEFRGEDPEVPIKPEHKMTVVQVRKEIEPQGFAFKEVLDFLPWQHIIIFERPSKDAPESDAAEPPEKP